MIKVSITQDKKGFELLNILDDKGIAYEVEQSSSVTIEVDGKILDYNKAMKWIKKYKGVME
jgi:hypothetical protein